METLARLITWEALQQSGYAGLMFVTFVVVFIFLRDRENRAEASEVRRMAFTKGILEDSHRLLRELADESAKSIAAVSSEVREFRAELSGRLGRRGE